MPKRSPAKAGHEGDRSAVEERRARALEEPLDVRLRSRDPYPLLEVRNPIHGTLYLVMLPEFPGRASALCTCTDFARRGLGTCKHIEAAAPWLAGHPDTVPLRPGGSTVPRSAAVWRRIESGLTALARSLPPDGRRWRRVGAVLYETSPN